MGKRARRRGVATEPAPPPAPAAAARRRPGRPRPEDRPKPPWHPVPLVELAVLVGIVLLVLGALNLDEDRGKLMLVLGLALGSLGGLDTALREHFAGYRSHTTILAGLPGVATAAALYFAGVPWPVLIAVAVLVFAGVFALARRAYMRRARRALRARG
jgi:hypothetical protein